ncbi:ataxin-7-like protein 1 isoform X2 [Daphnia pulicaria]|uniref:ataxin-7-like protein 1 isoform X2 n=1 Tax=Daphnia pulicaria TaxID=35523 RepID=UPI001EE9F090|nr:ataxin-7-like protein 1 isoform X2 [Daphnia pulicaria]
MASNDDSPTSLHGQPWSVWADRLGRDSPLSDTDEQSKVNQKKEGDAMKLPKQDMLFFGLCPVRDEFYLVTCNYCQRVCTPQGLKNHIELKHAQEWTNCQLPESMDNCVHPSASAPVGNSAKAKAAKKAATGQPAMPNSLAYLLATPAAPLKQRGAGSSSASKRVAANKPPAAAAASAVLNVVSHGPASSKIPAPVASALIGTPYDKIPSPQQPPPVQFSPMQPTLTAPSPVSPLTANAGVMTPSPAITMTVAVDSSGNQTVQIHLPEIGNGVMLADSPADLGASASNAGGGSSVLLNRSGKKQRKTSKSDRRMLPVKERELDLEKHCGVWMSDLNRACTRSLTCKAHSLTLRRAVQGRSRSFDDLLAEHRAVKELVIKQLKDGASLPAGAALQPVAKVPPIVGACQASAVPKLGRPPLARPPPAKKLLTSLLQTQPQSVGSELSVEVLPLTESQNSQQLPSSGLLQRAFPSTVMPAVSLTFTPHHPKPLAVCSFGLRRQVSRAGVAPDRKWDFLRSTVRSTLQRSAAKSMVRSVATASGAVGLQSLLRPSIVQPASGHHLLSHENSSIELPNGLQLSIGVQPEGHNHHHHRVRFKKSLLNGVTGGHPTEQVDDDLMEGFDGLVGEDGVLTFLNQSNEGTAALSLMADLSAGDPM